MEFPSNSHKVTEATAKSKDIPEKEVVESVVTGKVVKRRKPLSRRFKEVFLGADAKSAGEYLTTDVLLPAVRNLVFDAVTKGMERVVFGENARNRRISEPRSRYSYNTPVNRAPDRGTMLPNQPPYRGPSRRQEAGEIILVSREEAERVLESLIDIIDKYQVASVADLHSLVGLPTTFIDNKWGWATLHYVDIRQIREGFLLDLPSAEPI